MKICIYAVMFMALVTGCSKEKRSLKDAKTSLKGVWELRMASGGMTPPVTYAAGNGNRLQFDGSRFEKYENGVLIVSGTYRVVHESDAQGVVCMTVESGTFDEKIVFNPESDLGDMLIEIDGDKMAALRGCFATDGGVRFDYVRK